MKRKSSGAGRRIVVINRQRRFPVPAAEIKRLLARALGARRWTLTVAVVDNRGIRRINKQFLRHDYATDVIAFDLSERGAAAGDVVVSAEFAAQYAKREGVPYREELLRYCLHGTLHLLGHDDHNPLRKKRMWREQERILMRHLGRRADYIKED